MVIVAIPQITRDKLASSVVGTPGVDLSGQKAEESMASGATDIGQAIGQYAIERQTQLDQAESNRLTLGNNMAAIDAMEQAKTDYANEPEKAGPALMTQLQKNLETSQAQASNPRVALKVGLGNPYFDSKMAFDMQQWSVSQRDNLDKANIESQGNQMADQMEKVVDGKQPLAANFNQFMLAAHNVGTLTAGAYSVANPASAELLKTRMLPTLATRATYKLLQDNPAQATAFLEHPEIKSLYGVSQEGLKEWDELHKTAMDRTEGMAKDAEWHQTIQPLMDSPAIVGQIASPDNTANHVDYNAIAKFPPGPMRDAMMKMSMQIGSVKNEGEQAEAVSNFAADAKKIGVDIGKVDKNSSVADLIKFHTELMNAKTDGLITPSTFNQYYANLALPLRDAVLSAHDPKTFASLSKQGGILGAVQNWLSPKPDPQNIVNKYINGFDEIDRQAQAQGKDQDYDFKANAYKNYMNIADSRKPEDRDPLGRPWTPATNVRDALGTLEGRDFTDTAIGSRKIMGYSKAGYPMLDLSPQDQDKLNHLKAMQKAMSGA